MQADELPQHAIEALAELLLDLTQYDPCGPQCIRCGNKPNHPAEDGQQYCELCRGCPVDALPQADE